MTNEFEMKKEPEEKTPMIEIIYFPGVMLQSEMFPQVQREVKKYINGYIYIFFDMGSVKLDIDDPKNHIHFHREFVEIFNNSNGETTFIQSMAVKGFVFENKPVTIEDLEE